MNVRLVFNPCSHKAGSLRAPSSHQYLNLFLHVLIQAVDLGLKVLGKLSTLCFQCWCQEPVFNGKGLWVEIDAFDLEEKKNIQTHACTHMHAHTCTFISDLDFSAEPSKCYVKDLTEYFTL